MKAKCLILGGGGFIGASLIEDLLEAGFEVRVFDIMNFSKRNLGEFTSRINVIEGDFNNPTDLAKAIDGIDYVYHLISTTLPANSVLNPTYDIESNLVPTLKLLQLCLEMKVKKIIFISSGGTVYGVPQILPIPENHASNPLNSYGITKRTIESYFILFNKLWGLNICIFRLSNPFGQKQNPKANQGAIPVFLYKAIHREEIEIWGDGEVIRDYIDVKDVAKVLVKSIVIETPELIYNLGSGVGTSLNQILEYIRKKLEPDIKVNYVGGRSFDVPINILDITLLKKRFELIPSTDLDRGIDSLYSYLMGKNER